MVSFVIQISQRIFLISFISFSGVAIIFLTISALLVICITFFLAGLVLRRGICDPLKNPEHDQVFSYLDSFIDLNKFIFPENQRNSLRQESNEEMEPLRISQVISACHRNGSVFDVLRLENLLNIDQIQEFPKQFGINEKLNELADNVQITSQVRILNDDARRQIKELSKSELNNFEAYKYVDNLAENITHYDLSSLADRLKAAADRIPSSSNEIKTKLEVQQLHLRTYQKNLVEPLIAGTNRLLVLSKKLNEKLLFKQVSFEKAINMLIKEIDDAERFLNEQGTAYVQQVAHELLDSFSRDIKGYLNLVINTTKEDVGRCAPISNVYDSMIVATCNRVVDPFVSLHCIKSKRYESNFCSLLEWILGRRSVLCSSLLPNNRFKREAVDIVSEVRSISRPVSRSVSSFRTISSMSHKT